MPWLVAESSVVWAGPVAALAPVVVGGGGGSGVPLYHFPAFPLSPAELLPLDTIIRSPPTHSPPPLSSILTTPRLIILLNLVLSGVLCLGATRVRGFPGDDQERICGRHLGLRARPGCGGRPKDGHPQPARHLVGRVSQPGMDAGSALIVAVHWLGRF